MYIFIFEPHSLPNNHTKTLNDLLLFYFKSINKISIIKSQANRFIYVIAIDNLTTRHPLVNNY